MISIRSLVVAAALVVPAISGSSVASATSESFLDLNIAYRQPQTGDLCVGRQRIWTELGSVGEAVIKGTVVSNRIYKTFPAPTYVNTNLLASAPAPVPALVREGVGNRDGWYELDISVDVSALAQVNGSSAAGRLKTVRIAKLYLLALNRTLEEMWDGEYRLNVVFLGLPNQTGLSGTALHPATQWPYGVDSPLLMAYERELLNLRGSCRE